MLNLRAARELAAKELGTSAASKGTPSPVAASRLEVTRAVAPLPPPGGETSEGLSILTRFEVGDRVEYRSDTYHQWMQGTVQRVRDGGATYDLDVKKGAQASKLRPARGTPLACEDRDYSNGVAKGDAAGAQLQAAVRSGGGSSPTAPSSLAATAPASAAMAPTSPSSAAILSASAPQSMRPSKLPLTARSTSEHRRGFAGGPRSGGYEPVTLQDQSSAATALQAKQLQVELAHTTRQIQRSSDWAEMVSEDMASRAGAVTVRRMVETTKMLLQGLEEALILRAGFIASCFHVWRSETMLSRAVRLYQEEFERHHNQWVAHLEHHKGAYEEELRLQQEKLLRHQNHVQAQKALLMDQWAHGDKEGLLRQSGRLWRDVAAKEKLRRAAKARIHTLVLCWAEGKTKGTVHACVLNWKQLAQVEREVRRREQELGVANSSNQQRLEEERRQQDRAFRERLAAVEGKHQDRSRSIEAVVLQWERGAEKGVLQLTAQTWAKHCKKRKAAKARVNAVELQLMRSIEGSDKGLLHCSFLNWRSQSIQGSLARKHDKALQKQVGDLQAMLSDERGQHEDLLKRQTSEAEKRHREAKAVTDYVLQRWALGDTKGLLKATMRGWSKHVEETKRVARKRQAVHDALLRSIEGDKRAGMHICWLNWSALAKSQKQSRLEQTAAEQKEKDFNAFLAATAADHELAVGHAMSEAEKRRVQAHAVSELMLKKWMQGEKVGLLASVVMEWKRYVDAAIFAGQTRAAVKDAVVRFVDGEERGAMHMTYLSWKQYVKISLEHSGGHMEKDGKIDELEAKVSKMLAHRAAHLVKYAEMLGSGRANVLKGLTFCSWRDESRGVKGELEAQRRQEVELESLQRQHLIAEARKKEFQARALEGLGCRKTRLVLMEHFEAWCCLVMKAKEAWAARLNHNEAMLKYSSFIISKKLKQDGAALVASCFSEWHREGKILAHQRINDSVARRLSEKDAQIAHLERQRIDLQEQLTLYYQQIDLITETLQKELKTKEELAAELRSAYDKMRRSSFTPTTAATADIGAWSRTSSQQTLDDIVTPREASMFARGQSQRRQSGTGVLAGNGGTTPPGTASPARPRRPLLSAGITDTTPPNVDWQSAIRRMGDEGIVRIADRRI